MQPILDNTDTLLPGMQRREDDQRIVAVEPVDTHDVILFRRQREHEPATVERREFFPWLVTTVSAPATRAGQVDERSLNGSAALCRMRRFQSFHAWSDARSQLQRRGVPVLAFGSRSEQYLIETGMTLFRSMDFGDLTRAQIDIETLGLNPDDAGARIIIVSAAINGKSAVTWHAQDQEEPALIQSLTDWLQKIDPDVIEGHNLFNFDLPFLATRARRYGLQLTWGRDRSNVQHGVQHRFKAGQRNIPYEAACVRGRHLIDTYQQIQRYDIAGELKSYGLKSAIEELGLERPRRAHVSGEEIASVWESDPDRLIAYAIDDVLDTNTLSELTLPTEFYQTQLLPSGLQAVASGGPGEKVNDLIVRAYLAAGESIPLPDKARPYPGGYTAVRGTGIFSPVANVDVDSLYPSIMLLRGIQPRTDSLGVFLPILSILTEQRLMAKNRAASSQSAERPLWEGVQRSLKVLINSFYGYLGYSRAYFSDYSAAHRVTVEGHRIIEQIENLLRDREAETIEIDTDGIYFVPPTRFCSRIAIGDLVKDVSQQLEDGIQLSLGGYWKSMLSLKLKNYALLGEDETLTIRGSSLRSRRDEPFLREFIRGAILGYLDPDSNPQPRTLYFSLAETILQGQLPIDQFARAESITERTFSSAANRRLASIASAERIGERIRVYQRNDGRLVRIEDYDSDEDVHYLLRRLRQAAERFRPLYEDTGQFDHDFPVITPMSDLSLLRRQERTSQPKLF